MPNRYNKEIALLKVYIFYIGKHILNDPYVATKCTPMLPPVMHPGTNWKLWCVITQDVRPAVIPDSLERGVA